MKTSSFLWIAVFILGLGITSKAYAQGYEDGKRWGRQHGITDTEYNSDDTSDFAEGVRQQAKENRNREEAVESRNQGYAIPPTEEVPRTEEVQS